MISIPLTPVQFAAKAAALAPRIGYTISGTQGQIAYQGVTVGWSYDGTALTVDVMRKPVYVWMATVEEKIRGWFAG